MTEQPLVSVMALCYNHRDFLEQALNSVLNQTYANIELFIIDDNSTDGSQMVIEKWIRDHNVDCTFIKHDTNRTIGYSYNEFLSLAKGRFISSLATDDYFHPLKTQKQVELLLSLPQEFGIVYSELMVVDEKNDILHESFYKWYLGDQKPITGDLVSAFMKRNPVQVTGTLVRREVYDTVGPYDDSMVGEDWDMGLRWSRSFKFFFQDEVLAFYRKSRNQFNAVASRDKHLQFKIYDMIHRIFVKHLDLQGELRGEVIQRLKQNYIDMLGSEYLTRKQSIEISQFLFRTQPAIWSFFFVTAAHLNVSFLYPMLKSSLNRALLFAKNRFGFAS